jgi:hypothetical protein
MSNVVPMDPSRPYAKEIDTRQRNKKYKRMIGAGLIGAAVLAGTFFAGRGSVTDREEYIQNILLEERLEAGRRAERYAHEAMHLDPLDPSYQMKYRYLLERHNEAEKEMENIDSVRTMLTIRSYRKSTR